MIRSGASPEQKNAFFHTALRRDFDLNGICRFVLGPYWRDASEAQRQEFQTLLENYLVRFYGQRFAQYKGESLKVTGSRADHDGAIATSEIVRPEGPPIRVDWRLSTSDGYYKINDVVVDGVSMALTQRSEFAGLIQRNGGELDGLLATMREDSGGGMRSSTPAR